MADNQPTNEQWLPVVGWEGAYEVSDAGRVQSLPRIATRRNGTKYSVRGTMLRPALMGIGYHVVTLNMDAQIRQLRVHHLVMDAFVGPRPEGALTRHLNGDPADNRLTNLAYGTGAENSQDSIRHGTNTFHNLHAPKTHCIHGHELTHPNLRIKTLPHRVCRACASARAKLQRSPGMDFNAVADSYYSDIMRDAA